MVTRRGLLSVMGLALVAAWLFGRLTAPAVQASSEAITPDIAIASPAGERHLANMRGRVVLVAFFATWWSPSRPAMRRVEQLYRRYHPYGLEVIGVSFDPSADLTGRFARRENVTYPIGLPLNPDLADRYLSDGLPSLLLVDKRGVIRWRGSDSDWTADAALAPDIERLLDE